MFTKIFQRSSPSKNRLVQPGYQERPANHTQWLILQEGTNPTTDYYIKPKLESIGCNFVEASLNGPPPHHQIFTSIVVVRYLNKQWARWIDKNRTQIGEIVYFMDDELLRPEAWSSLPKEYQKKLRGNFLILKEWLPKLSAKIWVSTEQLRKTNIELQPEVVEPTPLKGDDSLYLRAPDASRENLIFYHATASHIAEFKFIAPIMESVLSRNPSAHFETIGDFEINRIFRSLPRTRVLHPMSWPNYLAYTRNVSGGLALAPLINSEFNSARSSVKSLDIYRMTRFGLYSKGSGYTSSGLPPMAVLLENDPNMWEEAIDSWLNR